MTEFVDMKPGQWVMAFNEPFGPYDRTMQEHLAMFTSRGGGWDFLPKDEIFHVYRVVKVSPKTYTWDEAVAQPNAYIKRRLIRSVVIAAGDTRDAMTALRDQLYAIGDQADDDIDFVVDRMARPVRKRVQKKALAHIHKILPHVFERKSACDTAARAEGLLQ